MNLLFNFFVSLSVIETLVLFVAIIFSITLFVILYICIRYIIEQKESEKLKNLKPYKSYSNREMFIDQISLKQVAESMSDEQLTLTMLCVHDNRQAVFRTMSESNKRIEKNNIKNKKETTSNSE